MIVTQEAPAAVPLDEVKAYLRIGNAEEDELLAGLVRAAGEACEAFTRRALIVREVEELVPASRAWTRLEAAPVTAIIGISAGGSPFAAQDYAIDIDAAGEGWVRLLSPVEAGRVNVSYQAGMAAETGRLPEALRHGIVRLAAHLYAVRGDAAVPPPAAVTALWRPWRRLKIG